MLPSILLTAAILLIPAALYTYGRQADAFAIDTVEVAGTKRVPKKEALRLLRKEFEGRNLFTVTSADVRAALDPLCYLSAVEVDRDFPTTLHVRVIEHRPLMYVLAGERWLLVADTGHVICAAGREEGLAGAADPAPTADAAATPADAATATATATPAPSPSASATAGTAATAGDAAATDAATGDGATAAGAAATGDGDEAGGVAGASAAAIAAALKRGPATMKPVLPRMEAAGRPRAGAAVRDDDVLLALRVLAALPASLRARIGVVRVDEEAQVTMDLKDGPLVELGGEERMRAKVLSLRAVLAAYRRDGTTPTMVDVSAPDRPLAQPRLSS
jgi:cell division septal protein FtsQ